jgi:hypothetical protein
VAGATPFPKVGWPDHPIFGQGGGSNHPQRSVWGGRSHPQALGGGSWGWLRPPQKAPKKKKKTERMCFGLWGWPDHPLGPGGGFGHPLPVVGGGFGHLHALWGGPATPKGQNPFFFFFGPFGVAGPPTKAWGGFGHPHTASMGWPKPPLGQKWGGLATPFLGRGWLQPPRFTFFFLISFFFSKKKKLKPKIPKTTPFWAKRRHFGQVQNGVVLE